MRIKVWVTSLGIKMELKISENVEGWRNFTHGEDAVDVIAKTLEYHKNVVGGIWKGWLILQGTLPWVKLYSQHISMKWLLTHLNWTLRVWPRRCVHRLPFWFVFSSSFHTHRFFLYPSPVRLKATKVGISFFHILVNVYSLNSSWESWIFLTSRLASSSQRFPFSLCRFVRRDSRSLWSAFLKTEPFVLSSMHMHCFNHTASSQILTRASLKAVFACGQ